MVDPIIFLIYTLLQIDIYNDFNLFHMHQDGAKLTHSSLNAMYSGQNLILTKMLTRSESSSLSKLLHHLIHPAVSVTSNPPEDIHNTRNHFRSYLSQPSSFATQSHPGATSCSEDVTLYSQLQFKILDFTPEVLVTTEIFACNYATFSFTLKTCNAHAFKTDSYRQ